MREICLDTETTGLEPRDGHKIIEIAAFEIVNKIKTGNNFHCYINPKRDVPIEAFRVHGISTEFLQDKPIFADIANDFLDFIKNDTLIIHNAAFDLKFINAELVSIGMPSLSQNKIIDTLYLARSKFPGSQNSLDALCKRFNIDLSKRDKHSALVDTELLCLVYLELTGGAQIGFGFNKNVTKVEQEVIVSTKYNIPVRDFSPTKEQLDLHKDFILKNFKKNYWFD